MEDQATHVETGNLPGVIAFMMYSDQHELKDATTAMYELERVDKKPVVVKVQTLSRGNQVSSCCGGCKSGAAQQHCF